MKTAVSLPDPLFKAAERLAKQLKMSRSELYRAAIEAFVKQRSDAEITASWNDAYADEGDADDSFRARIQSAALPKERW